MRHLTLEQLVDVAEGVRTEPSMPHLQSCEVCRTQLAELRRTLSAAREVDVGKANTAQTASRVKDIVRSRSENGP